MVNSSYFYEQAFKDNLFFSVKKKKKERKRLKIVFSPQGTEVTDLKNIRLLSSCLQNTIVTLK